MSNNHELRDTVVGLGFMYLMYRRFKAYFNSPKEVGITESQITERHGDRYRNGADIWFRK